MPRGVRTSRNAVGEFSFSAQAVVVASGGIGGNFDLVRRNWPAELGLAAAAHDRRRAGLRRRFDARESPKPGGGRVINLDRMWHYPEGILNHSPIWSHHGIRILAGPSSLWLDARGQRFPAPLFPGFDALGALRHVITSGYDYSWFVLDQATLGDRDRALRLGAERRPDRQGPPTAGRSGAARCRLLRCGPSRSAASTSSPPDRCRSSPRR